jgi:hypothetical protein
MAYLCLLAMLLPVAALAANDPAKPPQPKTTVHQEGDRVWLEGVNCWFIGDKESSVHAAQEAIMRSLGESVSYDYLVGVSGLAFRMQVSEAGLCPSSPHSCCGYRCTDRSDAALPWNTRGLACKPDDSALCEGARKAIVDSIDRGIPIQYGSEEEGLIVGYRRNGSEWICLHPMKNEGKKTFVETKWPWGMTFFTERKDEAPARPVLERQSLEQAVQMAKAEKVDGYFLGLKAWDVYLDKLRALDEADEKTRQESMTGNAWIYECLSGYRRSAARYLRSIAGDFPAESSPHLLRAADLYEKMATQVLTDERHCFTSIAPYPWSLKPGQTWTTEARAGEISRLQKALPLEREALRDIEKALAIRAG